MSSIITFLPNGEYVQGHIPKRKTNHRETLIDSTEDGMGRCLRECISAATPPPRNPRDADLQEWERRGTRYFGRNRSLWILAENTWDGYVFKEIMQTGEIRNTKIVGRGAKWLRLAGLEPCLPKYDEVFNIDADRYVDVDNILPEFAVGVGSSSVEILAAPKTRKKCLSMTKRMARNIRNGCYLLEERYGNTNLSFLTLTVPGLSEDAMIRVRANWGRAVNELFKWVRKIWLKRTGEQAEYVYCTEIQLLRESSRGEVAPHLHAVLRGRRHARAAWVVSYLEIRSEWASILSKYAGEPFFTEALENLQQVKKSAGGYLSKYMGKGQNSEACPELRTHWGGMSRNLCRLIRSTSTVWRSDGQTREWLCAFVSAQERLKKAGLIKSYKRVWISLEGEVEWIDKRDGSVHSGNGFWVGSGVLSTPTYCGGVVKVVSFLQLFN